MKIQTIILIIKRLIVNYFNIKDSTDVWRALNLIGTMYNKNGFGFTVKYIKVVRLHITRYICGKPHYVNSDGVSLIHGFPKKFLFLKKYADGSWVEKKILLTILNTSKALIAPKDFFKCKTDTIIAPMRGKGYIIPDNFIELFVKEYKLSQKKPTYSKEDYYLSKKSGPQGPSSPAVFQTTSCLEIHHWRAIRELMGEYKDLFSKFFLMCMFPSKPLPHQVSLKGYNGKICVLEAPEGKSRVIAMIDYYSQFVLRAIHEALFKKLKHFPNDRTFTQSPFGIKLLGENSFHSLDLSAATDRLPIVLQQRLLSYIYDDKSFAHYWRTLLVDRDFITPNGEPIRYSVGTPMGSYTSWAMLAYVHHLIVSWCWYTVYGVFPHVGSYIILGDDIVLADDKVAKKYISVMTRLGVDISFAKTHVSKDTYEFAKRWIHKDKEITGFPLAGIIQNFYNPVIIWTIITDYINKGNLYLYKGNKLELLLVLYKNLSWVYKGKTLHISSNYLISKVRFYILGLKYSDGTLPYEQLRSEIANMTKANKYIIPNERVGLAEIARLLSLEVTGEAIKATNQTNKVVTDARMYINKISELNLAPTFQAANNRLRSIAGYLQDFRDLKISLQVAVRRLVLFDFNESVAWDRSKYVSALKTGRIFNKTIKSFAKADNFDTFDDNEKGRFPISSYSSLDDKFKSLKFTAGPRIKSPLSKLR